MREVDNRDKDEMIRCLEAEVECLRAELARFRDDAKAAEELTVGKPIDVNMWLTHEEWAAFKAARPS